MAMSVAVKGGACRSPRRTHVVSPHLTVFECAALAGVSEKAVRLAIGRGDLDPIREGRRLLVTVESARRYKAARDSGEIARRGGVASQTARTQEQIDQVWRTRRSNFTDEEISELASAVQADIKRRRATGELPPLPCRTADQNRRAVASRLNSSESARKAWATRRAQQSA